MNRVIISGRLTRDAVTRYSQDPNAVPVSRFTLAVDRRVARNADAHQTADFISCIAFGKRAEFFDKYGQKGRKFLIEGRIQSGSYKNKEGEMIYTQDVVVDSVEFGENKSTEAAAAGNEEKYARPEVNPEDFATIPEGIEEEIPFL